jgi:tripartite-type tricarboxylate transporter receptor subunit TctC
MHRNRVSLQLRSPNMLRAMARAGSCLAALTAALCTPAAAQESWPAKPIRMLVPWTAGAAGGDIVARLVSTKLGERLGQNVYLEHKAGASGMIATGELAKAGADGYTIAIVSDAHSINPHVIDKLPYDTLKDFSAVTQLVEYPLVLVAGPAKPIKTLRDLLQLARSKPNAISYASGGPGSSHHIAMVKMSEAAGVQMTHVPYKGGAAAFSDVLAGHADVMFFGLSASMQHIEQGKVAALGVSSLKRLPFAASIPTLDEAGLAKFEFNVWLGLLAPAGTPPAIVQRLQQEVAAILADPAVKDQLHKLNFELVASKPAEFTRFLRADLDKYSDLVKSANLSRK